MTKEFVPYPELEDDLRVLGNWAGDYPPAAFARRLLRAFSEPVCEATALHTDEEPECGAIVLHWWGDPVFVVPPVGEYARLVCRQPRGHLSRHIPNLPAVCWSTPDK